MGNTSGLSARKVSCKGLSLFRSSAAVVGWTNTATLRRSFLWRLPAVLPRLVGRLAARAQEQLAQEQLVLVPVRRALPVPVRLAALLLVVLAGWAGFYQV